MQTCRRNEIGFSRRSIIHYQEISETVLSRALTWLNHVDLTLSLDLRFFKESNAGYSEHIKLLSNRCWLSTNPVRSTSSDKPVSFDFEALVPM